jgi:hypothetical protein
MMMMMMMMLMTVEFELTNRSMQYENVPTQVTAMVKDRMEMELIGRN